MNSTGLKIALVIAFVVGVICAVDPQLDIDLSELFFSRVIGLFDANSQWWVQLGRNSSRVIITLLVLPGFIAVLGKLIVPRRPMLIEARTALFLVATLAIGPGVVTNLILKDHWGRMRPIDLAQFDIHHNNTGQFTPWWDPRGECPNNCSFIAGEPSGAFWTLAPAALAPPELRALAYGAALVFGTAVSILRIAAGAHFFSDTVFAGVFMYLVIWSIHGLIYRWPATRLDEDRIEASLTRAGEALRAGALALWQRGAAVLARLNSKKSL
ncbi:MAG TPA: phosphatase PAP2 family protein [Xanthobacteraceae bacterium]|jgi:membrane-associated PAP2 superfamily phosphatase|nr:phosphatase PAP2 family protein [Xanthobacteraceae bacterium]